MNWMIVHIGGGARQSYRGVIAMSDKKPKKAKYGRVLDKRTKQIFKVNPNGIGDRENAILVPKGKTNTLMDVVYRGEVIGDAEIGEDGFLEMMVATPLGIVKIKHIPEESKVHFMVFGGK